MSVCNYFAHGKYNFGFGCISYRRRPIWACSWRLTGRPISCRWREINRTDSRCSGSGKSLGFHEDYTKTYIKTFLSSARLLLPVRLCRVTRWPFTDAWRASIVCRRPEVDRTDRRVALMETADFLHRLYEELLYQYMTCVLNLLMESILFGCIASHSAHYWRASINYRWPEERIHFPRRPLQIHNLTSNYYVDGNIISGSITYCVTPCLLLTGIDCRWRWLSVSPSIWAAVENLFFKKAKWKEMKEIEGAR